MKKIFFTTLFLITLLCSKAQSYLPQSNGEIVKHSYYTLSYVEEHEQAEWVYYQLTPESLSGSASRSDNFRVDKSVSTGSATLADYVGSGYDRGHLCPAGSMTVNSTAMSESFYMSNMSPQLPSFNRGAWKELEERVRGFAMVDSVLHVVTGPLLGDVLGVIGENRVAVPKYYYKVLYSPKKGEMIGFVMENVKLDGGLESYAVSVDYIESLSGIDFFSELEEHVADLESRVDLSLWSFGKGATTSTVAAPKKSPMTNSTQCLGITSSGARCKNQTKDSSGYCHLHQSQKK